MNLKCPHCGEALSLALVMHALAVDAMMAAPMIPPVAEGAKPVRLVKVKTGKARVCPCGHDEGMHENGVGACTHGRGNVHGGCTCPGMHRRRRTGVSAPIETVFRQGAPELVDARTGKAAPMAKGTVRVLRFIVQHAGEGGVTSEHITIGTGYKRSTRDAYLQRLSGRGFVSREGPMWRPTPAGRAAAGPSWAPLPTGSALRDHYFQSLPEGEARVLRELVGSYPYALSRELIGTRCGYKRSTRDTYLQRLTTRRLVHSGPGGGFVASSELFSHADMAERLDTPGKPTT